MSLSIRIFTDAKYILVYSFSISNGDGRADGGADVGCERPDNSAIQKPSAVNSIIRCLKKIISINLLVLRLDPSPPTSTPPPGHIASIVPHGGGGDGEAEEVWTKER